MHLLLVVNQLQTFLNQLGLSEDADNPSLCYYKYEVIQWGDEDVLLSDEQIRNTYFFNLYDSEEYPDIEDFFFKKYQQAQQVRAKPILDSNMSNHIYNNSGVKTIKVIIYRYIN